MSRIKICGLTRQEDILAVNEIKPDYCGFVIEVKESARCVSREKVKALTERLHREIIPVGVFVNAPIELPCLLLREHSIKMVQLHGQEGEEYIKELRACTEAPIIKAFSVRTEEDVRTACESSADYILFDQGRGGTGKAFDWSLLSFASRPFFLAGGVGIHNLKRAVEEISPWAVDMSSSLETAGKKDLEKMRQAAALVRKFSKERQQEENKKCKKEDLESMEGSIFRKH